MAVQGLDQLMALYNTVNAAVLDTPTLLPADCQLRDAVLANFEDEAPIAQWSREFLLGHQWLGELWETYVPEELDEEFHATPHDARFLLVAATRGSRAYRTCDRPAIP